MEGSIAIGTEGVQPWDRFHAGNEVGPDAIGAWKPARYAPRVNKRWMIYGAYGYTGELIAREAVARGMTPVLAGRRREPVSSLAKELGLEHRAFGLENPDLVTSGLEDMTLVLHSAGPYSSTSGPMVEGCLKTAAHYLDITGEIRVFESLHARDEEARNAGVIILPGVGFDVVPTDCLAARLASCIDRPTTLELAFRPTGRITLGTAKSIVESMGHPNLVRRGGRIVEVPMGRLLRDIPFSDKTRFGLSIPWGDVSTAYYSTGIPDITVYRTMHPARARKAHLIRLVQWAFRIGVVQRYLKWRVERTVTGPTPQQLAGGMAQVWGEVRNAGGDVATAELTTPNAYAFTAVAAVSSVSRLLSGEVSAESGFLTPSLAFGTHFVTGLPGVTWTVEPRCSLA